MMFGDALMAIQAATLTDIKNNNPKAMSIGSGDDEVIIKVGVHSIDGKTPFLYKVNDEYNAQLPWRPTQAQMFSKEWKLV